MDDDFLAWYHQSAIYIHEWNEWIEASPEHQHLARKAVQLLQCILLMEEKVVVPRPQ